MRPHSPSEMLTPPADKTARPRPTTPRLPTPRRLPWAPPRGPLDRRTGLKHRPLPAPVLFLARNRRACRRGPINRGPPPLACSRAGVAHPARPAHPPGLATLSRCLWPAGIVPGSVKLLSCSPTCSGGATLRFWPCQKLEFGITIPNSTSHCFGMVSVSCRSLAPLVAMGDPRAPNFREEGLQLSMT